MAQCEKHSESGTLSFKVIYCKCFGLNHENFSLGRVLLEDLTSSSHRLAKGLLGGFKSRFMVENNTHNLCYKSSTDLDLVPLKLMLI